MALIRCGEQGAEITIDMLHAGHIFGWSSLIEPHVHTVSARALRKSQLITIPGPSLKAILETNAPAGFEVMQKLARLLGKTLRQAYSVLDSRL